MDIALTDVQCGIGGLGPGNRAQVSPEDCLAAMRRVHIAQALVRRLPETEGADMAADNEALYRACAGHPELVPCPFVIPASGLDLPPEREQVAEAIRRGAAAVWIRPGNDSWILDEWVAGPLFCALEERRMPVLCLQRLVELDRVADLARRYPRLPLIVAETHYRTQRILLPLLRACANVHVSIGNNFSVHRGLEQIVKELGPRQLLFGTGYPESEPMAAITYLMYAAVPDEVKRQIGQENMAALRREIVR